MRLNAQQPNLHVLVSLLSALSPTPSTLIAAAHTECICSGPTTGSLAPGLSNKRIDRGKRNLSLVVRPHLGDTRSFVHCVRNAAQRDGSVLEVEFDLYFFRKQVVHDLRNVILWTTSWGSAHQHYSSSISISNHMNEFHNSS